MILDLILGVLGAIIGTIFEAVMFLIPSPPEWLLGGVADAWALISEAYVMDRWLPIDLALVVGTAVLGAYAIAVVIGVTRLIVSYFTLGSGAT